MGDDYWMPGYETSQEDARIIAAERERLTLIMQAERHHAENIAVEMRRHAAELDHINTVINSRTEGE